MSIRPTRQHRTTRRAAAACMIAAAALATVGFTGLGSVFDYPAILEEPTAEILRRYREHQGAITALFATLVVAAALVAPIAILLARLTPSARAVRAMRILGISAAVVQMIGLSRWVLLVPSFSDDALDPATATDAIHHFELAHTWLGHALGETVGYALSAAFTIVACCSLPLLSRWTRRLGIAAAVLVATGVLVPVFEPASLSNFAGYLLWTLWLVVVAIELLRHGRRQAMPSSSQQGATPISSTSSRRTLAAK